MKRPLYAFVLLTGLLLGRALPAAPPEPGVLHARVRAYREAHEAEILSEFAGFLTLPNLASDREGIARNAEWIVSALKKRGVAARILPGEGGPPAVFGERKAAGARRTVAIYAHFDGQAVDASQWKGSPWTPVLRDGPVEDGGRDVPFPRPGQRADPEWRLYARGAADDKAPIVGILTALDALEALGVAPSVDLKLFFEGEEEQGSPHLGAALRKNAELLKADLWLLCDGPVHPSRRMQLFFGARGVTDLELTLYGPKRPLHSGHYGNWAPNPALELAHLVAGLRDTDGRVLVPGFYDDVRAPTEADTRALANVPDVDASLREALLLAGTEAGNARLVERIMLPALNVRGLSSGHVGEQASNAIPTEARASIDFRLVPDQTPAKVKERVEAHLRSRGYHLVNGTPDPATRRAHPKVLKLVWGSGYPPARTPLDTLEARALAATVEAALGAPVVQLPTLGGSIPMYLFQEVLRTPVIGVPIANHDNNQHGANENLRLQNLWDAIAVYTGLLANLGPALKR